MDSTKEKSNPNPRDKANFLSILFFGYTVEILKKGFNKTLDVYDLYNPLKSDRSTLLGDRLECNWKKQIERSKENPKSKPSLLVAIMRTFWLEYVLLGILIAISDLVIRISQPYVLGGLLDYYNPGTTTTKEEALWYAAAIVILNTCTSFIFTQYMMNAMHAGMKVRASVCALVYRKSVKLSKTALGNTPAGKVVNLLSNDVSRFDFASMIINQLWVGPLSALIVMYFLFREAGISGIAGVIAIFIIMPFQGYTGRLSAKFRKQTALKTDERIRLMDEVICGIQVIKMYAWEKPFDKLIALARKAEIKIVQKASYVRAFAMTLGMFTTRLALFCTLLTMALSGQAITASRVYVFMSYFNILSQTLAGLFIRGLSEIAELFVSIRRIQTFLMNEEYQYEILQNNDSSEMVDSKNPIVLKHLSAKWSEASSETVLTDINLNIGRGRLIGIIGPVGCGKSSLLQTMLGELKIADGTMRINGTFSYASQEPWVFAATIRQNIVFGADYDKQRYNEVVRVCSLKKDFDQFPNRDHTIIGDKGASLSGGQKARVNLARAIYRDKDIYLLDDPLSAVDIHVSKHLYEECINGFLANKTRILVTHQVHYLKNADNIIILNNGHVENEGTFNELANSDNLYAKLLTAEAEPTEEDKQKQIEIVKFRRRSSVRDRKLSASSVMSGRSLVESILDEVEESDEEEEVQLKDLQEESSKGKVKGSLLLKYMSAGVNYCSVFLVLVVYFISQGAGSGVDWFISYWTNIEEYRNVSQPNISSEIPLLNIPITANWSTETCLIIYGVGLVVLLVTTLSRSIIFYNMTMAASRNLHRILFNGVIYATMRFFDTNPSGRILNRFAKDIGSVDEMLPRILLDAGQMFLQMGGSLILVSLVNPYSLILVAVIAIIFGYFRHVYLKSSKNIKRLEGMMRSPVFTHLNATLQGLTTIRAFRAEEILKTEFDQHQDYHSSAWFMQISLSSAYGFSLEIFCLAFIGLITFSCLAFGEAFGLAGGEVGLAITQATALSGMVQFAMSLSANIANQLMSVERVLEYKGLPSEIQPANPKIPPKSWPTKGVIQLKNVKMRYFEEGPLILKNLNLTVGEREKVGIVGRTGAGKSSLITALFRLANIEGIIEIDGIDTKDITLETLRSKISIIPQDPVLFSGTLRYNLDPFEEYSDATLYRAIQEVELKDPANIINRLENRVMDRGSNYSVGQRQLICLARALVRNNKILMLDEATANVDPQTDALIQKTIRQKFSDCTVLTIAHRLNTIMDSDKVLVMEAGQVAEYDHPHILLQNEKGIFYKMVEETGPALSEHLRRVAKDSYQQTLTLPE